MAKDMKAFFTDGQRCFYKLEWKELDGTKEAIKVIVSDVLAKLK